MGQEITEDMLPRDTALDRIGQEDDRLVGKVFYYVFSQGSFSLKEASFDIRIGIALASFRYKKPVIDAENILSPSEEWENVPREGYVPLTIVRNAYRGPHHWHREDDGLFCAFRKNGNEWETRYFPRQNIPESTWLQACSMLGKKPE